jgi:uncharacterized membrane protein YeaQ/YmgE (transglycosylase-associated protein family)
MVRAMTTDSEQHGAPEGAVSYREQWLARARAWPKRHWPWDLAAFLWGLAEATVFFLAAEILVTWLALANPLRALRAALFALLGAVIGAAILYVWGGRDPFSAMTLLSALPTLGPESMSAAEEALMTHGLWALPDGVLSPATGKAHAIYAQALGIGIAPFLAVYALARAARLLLAGCVTACVGGMLQCFLPRKVVVALWALVWAVILWAAYFHS